MQNTPRASPDAVQRLSQPKKPRVKAPGDSCAFAKCHASQLQKQRMRQEATRREEQQLQAAKAEALQGWHRAKQQVSANRKHTFI